MLEAFSNEDVLRTIESELEIKNCKIVNDDTIDTYYSYILFKRPHIVLISDGCGIDEIWRDHGLLVGFSIFVCPCSCQIPSVHNATLVSQFTYPELVVSCRNSIQPVLKTYVDTRTVRCWQRFGLLIVLSNRRAKKRFVSV